MNETGQYVSIILCAYLTNLSGAQNLRPSHPPKAAELINDPSSVLVASAQGIPSRFAKMTEVGMQKAAGWLKFPKDAQNVRRQGRSEREPKAYVSLYVEGLSEARTQLTDVFSILYILGIRSVLLIMRLPDKTNSNAKGWSSHGPIVHVPQ